MSDSTSRRPDRATAWLVGVLVLAALLRAGALAIATTISSSPGIT
jgi:hypothetical protein